LDAPVTTTGALLSVGPFTRGAGLQPDTYYSQTLASDPSILQGNAYGSNLAAAVAAQQFDQFTVGLQPGATESLTSLSFTAWQQNPTSATGVAVQYSTDGVNFVTLPETVSQTSSSAPMQVSVNLAAISALQNDSSAVTFRIYIYGGQNYTTSGLEDTAGQGLQLTGSVQLAQSQSTPAAPTGLTATPANGKVTLSWTAPSGSTVTGYNIYRGTSSGKESSTPINSSPVSSTSYVDTTVTNGTTYYYTVAAVNGSGQGASSGEASATPQAAPAAPTGAHTTLVSTTEIDLAWTDNATNAAGYNFLRSVNGGAYTQIATLGASAASYDDTTLTAGTSYSYEVDAFNVGGVSAFNTVASTTLTSAPTGLSGAPGTRQVSLTWTAPSGAVTFNVYRGTSAGGESATPVATGVTGSSFVDTGLTPGTTYYYDVAAVDAGGVSARSAEISASVPSAPGAPSGLTAQAGNAKVTLTWTAPSGSGVIGYNIYRGLSSGGESATPLNSSPVTSTSYVDNTAANGTTYYYTVAAVGTGGQSKPSAEASATPQSAPAAPTNAHVTSLASNQIGIAWTDNATNASGYNLLRSVNGGPFTQIATLGASATTYRDTAVSPATAYDYEVSAFNVGGTSGYSVVDPTTLTNPPTNLTGTASTGQASLQWTAPAGAVTFNVYRGTTAGGEGTTPVATGLTSASYVNTGLAPGKTYYYEVTSVDAGGESAASSEVAVTIPASTAATASLAGTDSARQGSWEGTYGTDGYVIPDGASNLPSYAQISLPGASAYVWNPATSDVRALQQPGSSSRLASTWYSGDSCTVDVNLTDGQSHQVALYLLDWDNLNRNERIDVVDATSGETLASQSVSGFSGGEYVVFNVTGNVQFRFTNTGGLNAVLGGIFFGGAGLKSAGSATSLGSNTSNQGTWEGVYGADGYATASGATSVPSYAQVSVPGANSYVWNPATSDVRALQQPGSTSRLASCWYSATSFSVNVDLTDGQTHRVALYFTDWDSRNRNERVDVIDSGTGATLASESLSSFSGGEYLVFSVSGNVQFRVTNTGGTNAVLGGIFFGGKATASYQATDTTHQGSWLGAYGTDGYAQVSMSGASSYLWKSNTSDVRGLQQPGTSTRLASCWYSGSSFSVNVNLTDGATHQIALYLLDWDHASRNERVDVIDADTGATLASQSVSSFSGGQYLVFNVSGNVQFRVTNTGGINAVLGGIFFGGAATAAYAKTDTTTQGNWQGAYGNSGSTIADGSTMLPSYAQVSLSGAATYQWNGATADVRALEQASSNSRTASCWYAPTSFTVNLNLTSGTTHQVALYLLDWDHLNRNERIDVIDPETGATLASQSVSNFSGGEYVVFNVSGNVQFRITNTGGGPNAVLSGLFIG
jgi:fibronectin type 3 domain-containing protein